LGSFLGSSWFRQNALSPPAHPRVTHPVGRLAESIVLKRTITPK